MTWEHHFSVQDGSHFYEGYRAIQAADGGYFLLGLDSSFISDGILKTDSTGAPLWYKRLGDECSNSWMVDVGKDVALAVNCYSGGNSTPTLLSLDPDGMTNWRHEYNSPANNYFSSVYVAADGGYIIAGRRVADAAENYRSDIFLMKTTSQGEGLNP